MLELMFYNYHFFILFSNKTYIRRLFQYLKQIRYTLVPRYKPGQFIILDLLIIKHELHVIPAGNLF